MLIKLACEVGRRQLVPTLVGEGCRGRVLSSPGSSRTNLRYQALPGHQMQTAKGLITHFVPYSYFVMGGLCSHNYIGTNERRSTARYAPERCMSPQPSTHIFYDVLNQVVGTISVKSCFECIETRLMILLQTTSRPIPNFPLPYFTPCNGGRSHLPKV